MWLKGARWHQPILGSPAWFVNSGCSRWDLVLEMISKHILITFEMYWSEKENWTFPLNSEKMEGFLWRDLDDKLVSLWLGEEKIGLLWSRRAHQFASTPDGDAWAWFREKCLEWIQIPSWGNSRNCFLLTVFSVFSINQLSARGPCNLRTKVFSFCVKESNKGKMS